MKSIALVVALVLAGCASAGRTATLAPGQTWFTRDGITREQFESDVREAKLLALEGDGMLSLPGSRTSQVVNALRKMGYRTVPPADAQPWAVYPRD